MIISGTISGTTVGADVVGTDAALVAIRVARRSAIKQGQSGFY
jgi:hypothetical protein